MNPVRVSGRCRGTNLTVCYLYGKWGDSLRGSGGNSGHDGGDTEGRAFGRIDPGLGKTGDVRHSAVFIVGRQQRGTIAQNFGGLPLKIPALEAAFFDRRALFNLKRRAAVEILLRQP